MVQPLAPSGLAGLPSVEPSAACATGHPLPPAGMLDHPLAATKGSRSSARQPGVGTSLLSSPRSPSRRWGQDVVALSTRRVPTQCRQLCLRRMIYEANRRPRRATPVSTHLSKPCRPHLDRGESIRGDRPSFKPSPPRTAAAQLRQNGTFRRKRCQAPFRTNQLGPGVRLRWRVAGQRERARPTGGMLSAGTVRSARSARLSRSLRCHHAVFRTEADPPSVASPASPPRPPTTRSAPDAPRTWGVSAREVPSDQTAAGDGFTGRVPWVKVVRFF